jgi:hypothetical protein
MPLIGNKKKEADNGHKIKQTLTQIETTREGCEAMEGHYDDKVGLCEVLQERDSAKPNQVTNKKFDEVIRPQRQSGIDAVDSF